MKIYCPAKINLFLNVLGIDKDTNMHKLFLINQTVDLYDEIELVLTNDNSIVIESNDDIPKDERNSIYKACKLIKDKYNIESITTFDMFPNTYHVENVVSLTRISS